MVMYEVNGAMALKGRSFFGHYRIIKHLLKLTELKYITRPSE